MHGPAADHDISRTASSGKNGNLRHDRELQPEFQGMGATMDDEMLPTVAAHKAWTLC